MNGFRLKAAIICSLEFVMNYVTRVTRNQRCSAYNKFVALVTKKKTDLLLLVCYLL